MQAIQSIGLLLGSSWAAGINLYLTVVVLGLAGRFEWIVLPGKLAYLSEPAVIITAAVLFLIEFFADKIPYVDTVWDAIHTVIRPIGGTLIAFMALNDSPPAARAVLSLLCGTFTLDAHLTKATARAAINTSPEPVTNSIASVSEDVGVLGILWLAVTNPVMLTILAALFFMFSIWFLTKMFHLLKKVFKRLFGKKEEVPQSLSSGDGPRGDMS